MVRCHMMLFRVYSMYSICEMDFDDVVIDDVVLVESFLHNN